MDTDRKLLAMQQISTTYDLTTAPADDTGYEEDLKVARAIAGGDRGLFKVLYDRNVTPLYSLAYRLSGSAAEADDIVQEAFVRAYQKIAMFAGRSSLSSWLYRICLNIGLEHLRRRKGGVEEITDTNCRAVEPDQKAVVLKRKLEAAIRLLPEGCKAVFILHDIEGFNHKEIAEQLHLAEGTSKSQLFKARAILRKLLASGRLP
jgi:RNA polymerase sigma-70 factor (ECF subfamily)